MTVRLAEYVEYIVCDAVYIFTDSKGFTGAREFLNFTCVVDMCPDYFISIYAYVEVKFSSGPAQRPYNNKYMPDTEGEICTLTAHRQSRESPPVT